MLRWVSSEWEPSQASAWLWGLVWLDASLFLNDSATTELLTHCAQGYALGVGVALLMWALGYAVWAAVDLAKGGGVI